MNDPLNDPRFPKRPEHPDFWRLSEAILALDGDATEGGRSAEDIIRGYIDPDSLMYVAQQRVIRGIQVAGGGTPAETYAMVCALYTDAFALGCRFTEQKQVVT